MNFAKDYAGSRDGFLAIGSKVSLHESTDSITSIFTFGVAGH